MISWYRTAFGKEEVEGIRESIFNEHISQGPVTELLEKKLSEELKIPYAVVTTSGSVALLMSMIALDINPNDEVIVPNRTWVATAHAPLIRGAKVTILDVVEDLPLMDVSQIEKKITKNTKAIIPVHLNGRGVDMKSLNQIAKAYSIPVVEDACQALFSKNSEGYLGAQSDIGCFSFGVTKTISTGQGGVAVTKNKELYERLKLIRNHGTVSVLNPDYNLMGCNFKFTDILASMGIVQLSKKKEKINHLNEVYSKYDNAIDSLPYIKMIPVKISEGEIPLYVEVLCKEREKLKAFLESREIQTRTFLPDLDDTSYLENHGEFPNSRIFSKHGLFLPCGPSQSFENIDYVIQSLKDYQNKSN